MTFARLGAVSLLTSLIAASSGLQAAQPTTAAQYQSAPPPPEATAPANGKTPAPSPRRRPITAPPAEPGEPSLSDQCTWIGKRIISLLVRDDAMTANDFGPFYQRFNCPEDRLSRAFGCVVANLETFENNVLADQVEECWNQPSIRYAPAADSSPIAPSRPKKGSPTE